MPAETAAGPAWTSKVPLQDAPADTLVITCVDARYGEATRDFLREHLGLSRPSVLALPGGVLALMPLMGFGHKFAKRWISSLGRDLRRIVIVAHHDCTAYQDVGDGLLGRVVQRVTGGTVDDLQGTHLREARSTLGIWFPGKTVELWFAAPVAETQGAAPRVAFTPVS